MFDALHISILPQLVQLIMLFIFFFVILFFLVRFGNIMLQFHT